MSGINLILLFLALFGFLPLAIILYKKNRVKKILTLGLPAEAVVYDVRRFTRSGAEIVYYKFFAQNKEQYTGSLTAKYSLYKIGDTLNIFYLADNPRRNTMNGAWGSPVLVGFGILLAGFILFAVYKLYEMVKTGSI
jgi:4-amino-4-deoxy-L-arabinose transferase-like glycosyltransferase